MDFRCWTYKDYEAFLRKGLADVKVRDDMHVDVVKNGTWVINQGTGAFGLFDMNGQLVSSALQYRGNKCNFIPVKIEDAEYVDCDVMFLGNAYGHFGHFLLEHLNRAWAIKKYAKPGMKFVFIDNFGAGAKGFVYDFARFLGIKDDELLILNHNAMFRNVYVPSQSLNLSGKWQAAEFIQAFDLMRENVLKNKKSKYDKVYVSRCKLPDDMRTYGEEKIQKIFEKNGFHVIYPETLPLDKQIEIIGGASVLAGCAGSALHMAVFMKSGGRVIQINRSLSVKDSGGFQYRLCQLRGLDFDIVSGSVEKKASDHGGIHAPQIIGMTEFMKKYFDDNGFEYSSQDLEEDKTAWEQYEVQMRIFKKEYGSPFLQKIKKFFIRIVSAVVPGRVNRKRLRQWLKKHL